MPEISNPTALTEPELDQLLSELSERERAVSSRRSKVFDRLEFLRASSDDTQTSAGQIAKLEEDGRRLSEERLELHRLIDIVRGERASRSRPAP